MLGNSVAFRDPSPSGEAYVTLAGASTGQGNESFGEKGSTRRKPSIEDLSFKSAKSLADSMCDDDSFTLVKVDQRLQRGCEYQFKIAALAEHGEKFALVSDGGIEAGAIREDTTRGARRLRRACRTHSASS